MALFRWSKATRFLTLLLAAIQIAAPAFVSVADGATARSANVKGSHVEQFGQNQCTPAHSADCAICRFLSANASDVPAAHAEVVATDVPVAPDAFVAFGSSAARFGFNSRAPPTLLG